MARFATRACDGQGLSELRVERLSLYTCCSLTCKTVSVDLQFYAAASCEHPVMLVSPRLVTADCRAASARAHQRSLSKLQHSGCTTDFFVGAVVPRSFPAAVGAVGRIHGLLQ